ncbi:transposase [Bradyrhizobium sp. CCBAU 21360]|uniref:transposase n=1 Tax=Bradyrhizobium sp. CCBAU 21360 TaxID=1325081 RepID=UPI002304FF8C|nr:transposase [Bradyrhizobium sp. CCBAU 21360]MDA9445748.1 hypothetical protein [Bradyrhizobium sp. CCBAU 21360]
MRRSRFSEEQIIGILKEQEAGVSVTDLCREHGVSGAATAQLVKSNRRANSGLDKLWVNVIRHVCAR